MSSILAGQKQAGRFSDTKHKAGGWVLALKGMIHTCVHTDTPNMDFLGPGSKVLLAERWSCHLFAPASSSVEKG